MAIIIQLRRGTAVEWTNANPLLEEGEIGAELDTGKFKMGNGVDAWNVLGYSSGDDGTTWYSGAGAPAGGLGVDGDHYLNTTNGEVSLKDTTWSVIANITGPQGVQGDPGDPIGNLDGGEPDTVYTTLNIDGGEEV